MCSIRKLSTELALKAKNTINEDEERIVEDLNYIKDWISKQPHLKIRMNDQWLLAFLRGCKYSLERTKEKLDTFYTLRTIIPEFYKNKNPQQKALQDLISLGIFLPLENKTDPNGPVLLLSRTGGYDPQKTNPCDIYKYFFIILDILMYENDNVTISGLISVPDLTGATISQLSQFTPSLVKKCSTSIQKAYPIRQKGAHFFNTPSGFETMFNLIKAFTSEKLKKRYLVHKDLDALFEHVPRENLPKEYGGQGESLAQLTDKWKKKIESYTEWFEEDDQYCSDEKLRPGKPKTTDFIFGIDGSFRQLIID